MPSPASPSPRPITEALVDDYDIFVKGVANMFDPYRDRVVIAELDSTMPVDDPLAELWYIPGTFTPTSFKPHDSTAPMGICRRRCPHASW